jgi:hypothetical protein
MLRSEFGTAPTGECLRLVRAIAPQLSTKIVQCQFRTVGVCAIKSHGLKYAPRPDGMESGIFRD